MKASPQNNWHYNKELLSLARQLRKNSTKSEIKLWFEVLRGKKMRGYVFNRQRPVLNYIVDFMCRELLLIIEIDGRSHHFEEAVQRDEQRQKELEAVGFTFLRFNDQLIFQDVLNVGRVIENWILNYEEGEV
ncbi:MAG: endonuclease domain-containing protein [Chitinophagales bacterium]